ncbi:MAG: hypothetical protein WCS77_08840 [Elusimicrobiaceae bacterium]
MKSVIKMVVVVSVLFSAGMVSAGTVAEQDSVKSKVSTARFSKAFIRKVQIAYEQKLFKACPISELPKAVQSRAKANTTGGIAVVGKVKVFSLEGFDNESSFVIICHKDGSVIAYGGVRDMVTPFAWY